MLTAAVAVVRKAVRVLLQWYQAHHLIYTTSLDRWASSVLAVIVNFRRYREHVTIVVRSLLIQSSKGDLLPAFLYISSVFTRITNYQTKPRVRIKRLNSSCWSGGRGGWQLLWGVGQWPGGTTAGVGPGQESPGPGRGWSGPGQKRPNHRLVLARARSRLAWTGSWVAWPLPSVGQGHEFPGHWRCWGDGGRCLPPPQYTNTHTFFTTQLYTQTVHYTTLHPDCLLHNSTPILCTTQLLYTQTVHYTTLHPYCSLHNSSTPRLFTTQLYNHTHTPPCSRKVWSKYWKYHKQPSYRVDGKSCCLTQQWSRRCCVG